ncbi:MAG: polyhydroxyalkanoic acid system family protein [Bradymonadales bacterium]|jgi:putative polyhydroxyalkanoate system protein
MAKIEKTIKHNLDLDSAKTKAADLISALETKYPSIINDVNWSDDKSSASVKGKMFSGDFNVDENELAIKIELGFLASPFKGRIETELEEQLKDFTA